MFEALQTVAEKFSSCHMDIVHNFNELVKDLAKYLDEQKSKHKQVMLLKLVLSLVYTSTARLVKRILSLCTFTN